MESTKVSKGNCACWEVSFVGHKDEYYTMNSETARMEFRDQYYPDENDMWAYKQLKIKDISE